MKNKFDKLPPELSCRIFSLLDIHSFLEASKAYDSWNDIMSHYDLLWKPHCLTLMPQEDIDKGRQNGNSWRDILMNWMSEVQNEWRTNGTSERMCPMDADTWGEIFEAEMQRQ